MRGTKWIAGGLLLVLLIAGAGLTQHVRLRVWWVLRGLGQADEDARDLWVERAAGLGAAVVEPLLDCLVEGEDRAGDNALAALDHLARAQGVEEQATVELAA